jgi:hypothetical protein
VGVSGQKGLRDAYVRLFAGADGESHFDDVEVVTAPVAEYARGVPLVDLSAAQPSTALTFVSAPPGWVGDWHPAPRRQFMVKLSGVTEVLASDGEKRELGPGIALLIEDTTGKGHYARVMGPDDDEWFVAALATQELS